MKMSRIIPVLLALTVLACLSGVQGQYALGYGQSTSGLSIGSSSASATSQYTQFYNMPPGAAPSVHISAPVQFNITNGVPSNLYFSNQMQAVPYSRYISNSANMGVSLWIRGATDWTQYAVVPLDSTLTLLAVSPSGGSGYLNEIRPDGTTYNSNFYFYPYSLLTFYADTVGRHILSFGINGQSSNTVIIDVSGTYTPPSNYYLSPAYYPSYYGGYYPGINGFGNLGYGGRGLSVVSNGATTSVTNNGVTTTVTPSGEQTVTPGEGPVTVTGSGTTTTVTPNTEGGTGSTITENR
jgi:hypothetical protein